MTTALVVVDVQDAWTRDNPYTTKAIKRAVKLARPVMPVIMVYFNSLSLNIFCQAGKIEQSPLYHKFKNDVLDDVENAPSIETKPQDWILTKTTMSLFSNRAAEPMLRERGIDRLLFVGYETSNCIFESAREAVCKRFAAVAVRGLVADRNDRNKPDALNELRDHMVEIVRPYDYGLC